MAEKADISGIKVMKDRKRLEKLIQSVAENKRTIQDLESTGKELKDEIQMLLVMHDMQGVRCGSYTAAIITKQTSRVDKTLLLENGVDPAAIAKSTRTTEFSYVDVREDK